MAFDDDVSVRVVMSNEPISYSELLDTGVAADWDASDNLVQIRFVSPLAVRHDSGK